MSLASIADLCVQRYETERSRDPESVSAEPIAVAAGQRVPPDEPTHAAAAAPPGAPTPAPAAKTRTGIPAGAINNITAWVPTEIVAAWVAVIPLLDAVVVPAGKKACDGDYGDRWLLFGVLMAVTWALVVGYTALKTRASTTPFKFPISGLAVSTVAWTLWAFALLDSPFNDICGIEEWHRVLAVIVGGIILAITTALLRQQPAWSETSAMDSPPTILKP